MKTNGVIDSAELIYSEIVICVILSVLLRDKLTDASLQLDGKSNVSMVLGAVVGMVAWVVLASYYEDTDNDQAAMHARMRVYAQSGLLAISGGLSSLGLSYVVPAVVGRAKSLLFSFETEGANPDSLTQRLLVDRADDPEVVSATSGSPGTQFLRLNSGC